MSAPPGQLFTIGGCRLHLWQQGSGGPTVVLESGIAGSLLSWALVQPEIARFTRVCSYDRAGLGWSDACSSARSVEQMVWELATLLEQAGILPPYILVGHSFGGLLIRAYAYLRPSEVAGLVFVDPVSLRAWSECGEQDQQRLLRGIRLSKRGAWLAHTGLIRFALWALVSVGPQFPKLIARTAARQGVSTLERLTSEVRRLPQEVWPKIRWQWSRPKSFTALATYLECLPEAAMKASTMPLPPGMIFTVLSAANATETEMAERNSWMVSTNKGQHRSVANCGHWIQLERPELVVAAVLEIWQQARSSSKENPLQPKLQRV